MTFTVLDQKAKQNISKLSISVRQSAYKQNISKLSISVRQSAYNVGMHVVKYGLHRFRHVGCFIDNHREPWCGMLIYHWTAYYTG